MAIKNELIWAASPSTTRGQPTQLAADPKGERLAYASNKSVFLRSIDNPAFATQYTEHRADTTVARFSPSGYYVASGDAAGTVRVWDCVGEGITKGEYFIVSGRINDLAWDGDSQRIIAVGDGKQRYGHCISADSGNTVGQQEPTRVIHGHQKNITSIARDDTGPKETLWTGSYDGRLCSWDVGGSEMERVGGEGHPGYVAGLAAARQGGGRIYSVGWDDTIRSVDISSHSYVGNATKLSSQPKGIAAGENTVLVANFQAVEIFQDGKKTGEFLSKASLSTIAAVGTTAALGAEDSSVQIYTVTPTGLEPKANGRVSRNPITAMAFSPDGSLLAAGDSRGRIVVFKAADGTVVTDRWTAHTGRVASLAWNSKGTQLVSGALDTNIFVWSLERPGDWLEAPNAHKEGVNAVAWIADDSKGGLRRC
ncbi:WD domain, G-beta repeat containing protein [Coccidioides immitis RMSCC 3703]|uniref:WD domain, G-beta repeat containing protein n=1 Tax=Coccidioides immitis RMSCC 3703 TaxID=454286 RepID=A0A0J8TGT6_COCIT|nr:WD domain, G-beta repeat containing protein [Coccidioides immitis RMSCC 3703]